MEFEKRFMKILVIGGSGTIGKRLTPYLRQKHEVITVGRNSGHLRADITSEKSIEDMYRAAGPLDACICIAASGPMDNFSTLTREQLLADINGKLFGQISLVLIGQRYLKDGGCFTLTSGIFADIPHKGVTGGGMLSGALHSFVFNAAIELPRKMRINVVSPGLVEDSARESAQYFPELVPVSMDRIVQAYAKTVEEYITGQIIRVY
jgi:NAD(P)-dependent dehydrogenase (short-subunit alcohol dehydrogenase family)